MDSKLDALSAKVRTFFARVDPGKSQAEMDEVVFAAYSKGEAQVNADLRARYRGMDLNSFQQVYMAQPVESFAGQQPTGTRQTLHIITTSPQNGLVLGPAATSSYSQPQPTLIVDPYTNQQRLVYVQQVPQYGYNNGGGTMMTPFSSSQSYPPSYEQYRAQKAQSDTCFCLTFLLACLVCTDF